MSAGWLILAAAFLPSAPPLAAQRAQSAQGSSLAAAAAASGRPPECLSGSRRALARGPSIWEQARLPNLSRYCDLMARAHAQLASQPDAARAAALEADKALPGRAAPKVVAARAALALGAPEEAAAAFDAARAIDPRSVEDPKAMHDHARTLARIGKREAALSLYRALVPRVDLLGTTDRRVAVLLEAAHVSMAVEGEAAGAANAANVKKGGKPKLDEAIAYLREARLHPGTQLAGDVILSLALALDRAGDRDAADAVLADAQRASARLGGRALDYVASPGDEAALGALAAEGSDRAAATKAWEGYLAGPGGKGPWAAAARAHVERLGRGGGAGKPAAKAPAGKPAAKPGKAK